ncbi:Uncharacterised protein [Klebsiella quasipneumoniae]|nr:Uncharacterised protein [Klebsiella quasipneumoniae]
MLRQSDITQAFRESIAVNQKGYRYLHTRDFVCKLQERGIHFSGREANAWIGCFAIWGWCCNAQSLI